MRNPNGYGTVYKLSGKRRKPWAVAITTSYELVDGKAKRKRVIIGYYATKREGVLALAEYNSNPYDLGWTFKEVFENWKKTKHLASFQAYNKAYERLKELDGKLFANITLTDLEAIFEASTASDRSKVMMKLLLNQMYTYAMRYNIVRANLAERIELAPVKTKIDRVPFTDEEIKQLWESPKAEAKIALIMIYTGVRVGELLTMEIDKENWLLKGGSKTEAGKNRIVPIREKIKPLMDFDRDMTYNTFYQRELYFLRKMNHTAHDCRVTFASRYKAADPTAIKLIMGHAIQDITKGVYTKYTPDELRKVIESVDF